MRRGFLSPQRPRQAAPTATAAQAQPGPSDGHEHREQRAASPPAPQRQGQSANGRMLGDNLSVVTPEMATAFFAQLAAAPADPEAALATAFRDGLDSWKDYMIAYPLLYQHFLAGAGGNSSVDDELGALLDVLSADLSVFDVEMPAALRAANLSGPGLEEVVARLHPISTMQVTLGLAKQAPAPAPMSDDLRPELWGIAPFDVKFLILSCWLQYPTTRILRRSEARRRALVLASVGNHALLQLARRHLWSRPDIAWPALGKLQLSRSSRLLIEHFNHPGLPRMTKLAELRDLVDASLSKYPNLRTLVVESPSDRWPISLLVERATGAGVTSLSMYGATEILDLLSQVPKSSRSSSLAKNWPDLERLSITVWSGGALLYGMLIAWLAFVLSDPPPKLRTIVLRLSRHTVLNATFGPDKIRDESWMALVRFASRQNRSPLHLRPGVEATLEALLDRKCSGVAGRRPQIFVADLLGIDDRLKPSPILRRIAKSEQRSLALGELGVWAFSEHANATLPDAAGDNICASVFVDHAGEIRLINDSSKFDSWAAIDGTDECNCPPSSELNICPPQDLTAAIVSGTAGSWRCVPTLSGRRRHIRTHTRIPPRPA